MTNVFAKTAEFCRDVTGLSRPHHPTRLLPERKAWTSQALSEELLEFMDASTIEEEVDALVDLTYFAAGRLHEMGVNGRACFQEVHRANMEKVRGQLAKRPGSMGYDAIKPAGWEAPDIGKAMQSLKLCIIGYGRHGKDTVCEILRDDYGLAFQSSSVFCAERVMMPYFASIGKPYASVEDCYNDRHYSGNRAIWYEQIRAFNEPDLSALGKAILAENDVYCGLRHSGELVACIKEGLFDHIIWVDRSRHVPPEDASSCSVTKDMADFVLDNNWDMSQLRANIRFLMGKIL